MAKPPTTSPRASLVHPELFGRPGPVEWLQPATADEYASLRAAELQHFVALEVGNRLRESGQSRSWLEENTGIAAGRISKLVRGHAQLTLRDLQALEGHLGPILTSLQFERVVIKNAELRAQFSADAERWGG